MKIVALIASHKRDTILRDCLACIMPQVDEVVVVGSTDWVEGKGLGCSLAKKIVNEFDCIYVDHRNKILGEKWQAGLNRCRELSPDAILICGSDDLISPGWVDEYKQLSKNNRIDLFGTNIWYVYNPIINDLIEVDYISKKRQDPIGAGRIINKFILDQLGWEIFPHEAIGCDIYSYNRMRKVFYGEWVKPSFKQVLLSVKGNWQMLDSWEQIIGSKNIKIYYRNPFFILSKFVNPKIDFEKYKK